MRLFHFTYHFILTRPQWAIFHLLISKSSSNSHHWPICFCSWLKSLGTKHTVSFIQWTESCFYYITPFKWKTTTTTQAKWQCLQSHQEGGWGRRVCCEPKASLDCIGSLRTPWATGNPTSKHQNKRKLQDDLVAAFWVRLTECFFSFSGPFSLTVSMFLSLFPLHTAFLRSFGYFPSHLNVAITPRLHHHHSQLSQLT